MTQQVINAAKAKLGTIYLNEERAKAGIDVRWMAGHSVFFVDCGHVKFSVSKTVALLLAAALREAVSSLPVGEG